MIKKSKLSVSVHDVQFAKDFQYQITVIYEGAQKSTDVSAVATSPIFINNTLIFDLPSYHTLTGQIIFVAGIINDSGNGKTTKKTLGQCSLDLTPLGLQPTQTYNLPIRQQLKFTRSKDGNEITVGKFISSIKIVQEEDIPTYLEQLETKKIEKNEYFVELPDFDSHLDFVWRIRLQVRQAMNIPDTDTIKPQVFVETGWTQFRDMLPQNSRTFSSSILNTNNPEWNQTFLITNPSHITSQKGFIMITVKDNHNLDDVFRIYVPVQSMVSFVPYNIKAIKDDNETLKTEFFFSIMLEMPYNQKDKLHDVVVNDISFDPIVAPFKTFNLVLVSDSQDQPRLNFYPFNVRSDSIQRIFEFDQTEEFSYIMSQNMRIPPIKSSKWRAATILTVSENLLRKPISLYIVGKLGHGKYKVGGIVENIQKDLINLLIEKVKKKLFMIFRPHPSIKMGKCQIQLSDKSQEEQISQLNESKLSQSSARNRGQQTASQKLMKDLNVSSSEGLFKHVQQNNEIIVRMLRQLDDKSESLRQAAAEISSLRNKVKLLQNENSILKRNAMKQEDELINLVQRQVENMSNRDLKQKIGKISHLYKSQKLRSEQLDRALKHLQPQVSNSMKLQSVIASQKNQLQLYEEKILKYKKQFDRIGVYKDTIKKQEKVIMKLESVMKDGMEEVRQARKYKLELEEMKKRGGASSNMYQSNTHSNRNDRQQIQRLQRIIAQMQMQQSAKMQGSSYSNSSHKGDKDQSLYELQFKLHQAETRIKSLEEELQEKSRSYGRELAMFKMKLVEKEAVLNGYQPYY